jgi:hypothetical protein
VNNEIRLRLWVQEQEKLKGKNPKLIDLFFFTRTHFYLGLQKMALISTTTPPPGLTAGT